jgi:hypothetical protein
MFTKFLVSFAVLSSFFFQNNSINHAQVEEAERYLGPHAFGECVMQGPFEMQGCLKNYVALKKLLEQGQKGREIALARCVKNSTLRSKKEWCTQQIERVEKLFPKS